MQDSLKMTGELEVILRDENGNIKDQRLLKNLVVTAGKNFIASRISSGAIQAGTITTTTSSTAVTGVSTAFATTDVGRTLYNLAGTLIGTIASYTSATSVTLSANAAVAVTAGQFTATAPLIGAPMSFMELGTGITAAALGDTALQTPIAASRTALSSMSASTNVISHAVTFGAGVGTGAVTEAGLFNAATAGTMLSRTTFAAVNKLPADSLTINWNVTVA